MSESHTASPAASNSHQQLRQNRKRGFTLLELVIVMGVVGLLIGGLFELTAASTRQINDQVTAQQMQQYVRAARSWIAATRTGSDGGTIDGTARVLNTAYNVTAAVQGFRQNSLPLNAPNGGTYTVVMRRIANAGGQALYVVSTSVIGGRDYSRPSLGGIASYIGADGAVIHPAGEGGVTATADCTPAAATIRGAFGATCRNLAQFTTAAGFQTLRPATLSYVSMLDLGINDQQYLWRIPSPDPTLNQMNAQLTMIGANSIIYTGMGNLTMSGGTLDTRGGPIFSGLGEINSQGGNIFSQGGNLTLAGGQFETNGGNILTQSGNILTGGGGIVTNNGHVALGNGNVTANDGTFQGTLTAGSFIYTSSDRALKKDIAPLKNALDNLLQVNGVSYRLKSSDVPSLGVIAQDVEKIFPELVTIRQDGNKIVNYNGLIAPIIESLRELKAENDAMKAELKSLKEQLDKVGVTK